MKDTDINEHVKNALVPYIVSDWKILPSEDLADKVKKSNERKDDIKIDDANLILWFAKGKHDTVFFLKDYSLEARVENEFKLPTEYLGALVVHTGSKCFLSATWHGHEFVIVDSIKAEFLHFPISDFHIDYCFNLIKAINKNN